MDVVELSPTKWGSGKNRDSGNKKMGFRASNALASIQAFQSTTANTKQRASMSLGMDTGGSDAAELRIENERLKTTLMILN